MKLTKKQGFAKVFSMVFGSVSFALAASAVSAEEVTLRAVNAFQEGTYFAQNFENFVKRVNEEGKGVLQIRYLGGPKAISPGEHATALRRGVIDLANTTASYTANIVPEGMILNLTPLTMQELRKEGAVDYLNGLYLDKGMYYLGRTAEGIPYHIYTNKKVDSIGDFAGQKLRVAPIYRDFFKELGINMLQTQAGEVYTALERGAVDGYGWPLIGVFDLGWQEKTKYRVDPGFYSLEVGMVMSKAAWEKLTDEQRTFLEEQVVRLEGENIARAQVDGAAEIERMKDAGIQTITLNEGEAAEFVKKAYDAGWASMIEISPTHAPKLRELSKAQ